MTAKSQNAAILTVDDIVVRFETAEGQTNAVDEVYLHVKPGEFLSVIRPSGCGKSTPFHVIAALLTHHIGVGSVAGETIDGPHKLARHGVPCRQPLHVEPRRHGTDDGNVDPEDVARLVQLYDHRRRRKGYTHDARAQVFDLASHLR